MREEIWEQGGKQGWWGADSEEDEKELVKGEDTGTEM